MADNIIESYKKQVKFAWAKYYRLASARADDAAQVVSMATEWAPRDLNNKGAITMPADANLPEFFTAQFFEMARRLNEEFTCPICLELVDSTTIRVTKCGHIYHKACFDKYIDDQTRQNGRRPKCAMCRGAC